MDFQWPLTPQPSVLTPFQPPAHSYGPGHRGVDLAAAPGAPVLAAAPGTVTFAGPVAGRNVVSIDHSGGLRTTYEPLTPTVSAGQRVQAGQTIGTLNSGHSGCSPLTCLHWGLREGENYLDPLSVLDLGHIRLLPLS